MESWPTLRKDCEQESHRENMRLRERERMSGQQHGNMNHIITILLQMLAVVQQIRGLFFHHQNSIDTGSDLTQQGKQNGNMQNVSDYLFQVILKMIFK